MGGRHKTNTSTYNTYILNLIICITAIFTSLILAELGLRLIYYIKITAAATPPMTSCEAYEEYDDYYGKYTTFPEMEYNTYLGYIPKASVIGKGYQTNRHHFRYEQDFPVKKAVNEIRIFITGGSTAWGAGVNQAKLYTKVMEELFGKEYPNLTVRVISAAVGAYCSVQERIMVENLLLKFCPDYVIMFSGWNDTYFGYTGKDILIDQDYLNYRAILEGIVKTEALKPPIFKNYSIKLHYLIDKAFYMVRYRTKKALKKCINENACPPDQVIQTLVRNIHIISDLSKRYGFKLIFYLQPTIYSTKKTLTDWEKQIVKQGEDKHIGFPEYQKKLYSLYRARLPREAQKNAFLYIDGDNAIMTEAKSVFADHVHFGDRGNRLIAKHLFKVIKTQWGHLKK